MRSGDSCSGFTYWFTKNHFPSGLTSYVDRSVLETGTLACIWKSSRSVPVQRREAYLKEVRLPRGMAFPCTNTVVMLS